MPAIPRFIQKIFGGSIPASGNISKFGSYAAGSPQYSADPSEIQTARWEQAWPAATVGNASPPIQDANAVEFVMTMQLAYIMQSGLPEWHAGETYFIGGWCRVGAEAYISLTNDNIGNNPVSDTNNWISLTNKILGTSASNAIAKAWVAFSGVTGNIISQFNVASINKLATGAYRINYNTPLNYANNVWAGNAGTANGGIVGIGDDNTICGGVAGQVVQNDQNSLTVYCVQGSTGQREDANMITVIVFGYS